MRKFFFIFTCVIILSFLFGCGKGSPDPGSVEKLAEDFVFAFVRDDYSSLKKCFLNESDLRYLYSLSDNSSEKDIEEMVHSLQTEFFPSMYENYKEERSVAEKYKIIPEKVKITKCEYEISTEDNIEVTDLHIEFTDDKTRSFSLDLVDCVKTEENWKVAFSFSFSKGAGP
ncbi:MAG: hypothetical protein PHV06_09355 [bacterium]|nr:hypothetical protein [bacterium]